MHPLTFEERLAYQAEHEAWRRSLPPSPVPDQLTGMKLRSPDSRDVPLAADPAVAEALVVGYPETFDNVKHVRHIYNQGAIPSCVSHTTAGMQSVHQVIEEGVLRVFDAPAVHAATGNINEGRWPDQILRYCQETGMPLLGGGTRYRIQSYAFVAYDAQWEATIKAAVSVGKVVCIALLLPSNFGWESSGQITQGYHEVYIIGYRPNAFLIVNSWGENWGKNGMGWVPIEFLRQQNWQNRYVLVHSVVDVRDITPPPPPPDTLTVTGYDRSTVAPGQSFIIFGSGFKQGLTARWEPQGLQIPLTLNALAPTQISVTMPADARAASGAVRVLQGADSAVGPFLTVGGDTTPPPPPAGVIVTGKAEGGGLEFLKPGLSLTASGGGYSGAIALTKVERGDNGPDPLPPPPPDQRLEVLLRFRRFISTLQIIAVVRDAGTEALVAGAACTGTANQQPLPALPTNMHGYVIWSVARMAGECHVRAVSPDGRMGEARQALPGWSEIPELQPGEDPQKVVVPSVTSAGIAASKQKC